MSANPIVYCLEQLTDYPQFERLCTDVMNQSGYSNIEPLGGSNDKGRDAIHVSRTNPSDITIFAFSVRGDWEQKLLNEDCKRIKEAGHDLNRLIFACTSSITSTQKDDIKEEVATRFGWTLDLYDLERIRTRLTGDLRYLIAQHPAIFCPPFFPRRGGLSIAECRDTLVIDHHSNDHALATWLARRLQLAGHRTWCYGTAPLAGEAADDSIRVLIAERALRYLPLISGASLGDADFVGRVGMAVGTEGLVLPCVADTTSRSSLPSRAQVLAMADFARGWSVGLQAVLDAFQGSGLDPVLDSQQGRAIALRSYVPEPVTKEQPEHVFANVFRTIVPSAIQICELARDLSISEMDDLRRQWAFVEAESGILFAFENPPGSVPLKHAARIPAFDWKYYEYKFNKRSIDVVKELVRRSLDIACLTAGLKWCGDRRKYFFDSGTKPQLFISFTHVDGRKTRVAVTGEKQLGSGERASSFRYQLCPTFRVGQDEQGSFWVTMRLYVRITDVAGQPHQKKAIIRRRKNVTKSWWNQEWFARTVAVMQNLGGGTSEIAVGSGSKKVSISTEPFEWDCPVAIDYVAVERMGNFQEELAELRYVDEEDESDEVDEDEVADE